MGLRLKMQSQVQHCSRLYPNRLQLPSMSADKIQKADMNIEEFREYNLSLGEFREYCLSLGEVTEKTPFGKFAARFDSVLVFYVCDHVFCMADMNDFTYVVVKDTPEKIADLHETKQSVERQRNLMAKYWIQLNLGGDIPVSGETIIHEQYLPAVFRHIVGIELLSGVYTAASDKTSAVDVNHRRVTSGVRPYRVVHISVKAQCILVNDCECMGASYHFGTCAESGKYQYEC